MMDPMTMRTLQDHRIRDMLREAEKRQLLKEARANRITTAVSAADC